MTVSLMIPRGPLAERYAPALATLPQTYRAGGRSVAVVDGHSPSWPAALEGVASAGHTALLSEPVLAETGERVSAVVDLPWSGAPVAREAPRVEPNDVGLISATFVVGPDDGRAIDDAATDVLMSIVRLCDTPPVFTSWRQTRDGLTATGELGGALLRLSGVRSSFEIGSARVVLRSANGSMELKFPAPGAAWPGTLITTDESGDHSRPTVYSDAHRTSLVELARVAGGASSDDLRHYARAAAAVLKAREVTFR
jgi:hypothetical protein